MRHEAKRISIVRTASLAGIGVILVLTASSCGAAAAGEKPRAEIAAIRILPPEVSKSLKVTPIPTQRPVPLLIGQGWTCLVDPNTGFENCEPYLVVCTNSMDFCTCSVGNCPGD